MKSVLLKYKYFPYVLEHKDTILNVENTIII